MNAIGIRTRGLVIPTLAFGDVGCENESCSRDRALSNQLCPTGRFLLEVPQWIDFCSRGNLRFLKSYCSLNMYIWHNIFDFFMTQMRISNSISGYPGRQNPKPQKMKVVAGIELFRTNHARPAGSAWKCPKRGHKVVGGTAEFVNAIGIRTHRLAIPTLAFGHIGLQHESCSRDRALSNEICASVYSASVGPSWGSQYMYTSRRQTTLVERNCPELELSVPELESAEGRSPRLDFWAPGSPKFQTRKSESCSRDRALSNQPCPTGWLRREVPQPRTQSSRGNFKNL